jgi:imidazolonepropionase-like amidohydrolase
MIRNTFCLVALLNAAVRLAVAQQGESPLPALPPDIPKQAEMRMLMMDMQLTGQDAVWRDKNGVLHEFFQFNDRGRGPKQYFSYNVDDSGLIVSEDVSGVDYMKTQIAENFAIKGSNAVWKNQAEDEKLPNAKGKFYSELNSGLEGGAILARALLLSPTHTLPLLPSGTATIRKRKSVEVEAKGRKRTATLYEIGGLSFEPVHIWLTAENRFFAVTDGWFAAVEAGFEATAPTLREAQREIETQRGSELARTLTHKPSGDLVIRNAALFRAEDGTVVPKQRVTIRKEHIFSVEPDEGQAIAPGAEVIDAQGKMLLPGLWDMHSHLNALSAYLNMAAGVTTVRDLGNQEDELGKLRHLIDDGQQIGPRVVPAGFLDGPGPFEGPVKVFATTPEEAKQRVDHYADVGYVQIKIYSSVKPELVPLIAEEAHRRGLRVSGHVPSGMTAEQFVRAGADEIQHMNFIFLNFMPDVKETRTPARFIEPGQRAADLDLNSTAVNNFIGLLRERHTVVDPTMAIWEATYVDRSGKPGRADLPMFDRLPVQVQRSSRTAGEALSVPDAATDKRYRDSYANMVRMVKKLYDGGVQLVAGTDSGSGWELHRELEIYSEAGIPASRVLRMATLEAAKVVHRDGELGSIARGKFADMILVDGDPTRRMSDIRRIDLVLRNGEMYKPAELYEAIGVRRKRGD